MPFSYLSFLIYFPNTMVGTSMWELCLLNMAKGGRRGKQRSVLTVPKMSLYAGNELLNSTKLQLLFFFLNKRNKSEP